MDEDSNGKFRLEKVNTALRQGLVLAGSGLAICLLLKWLTIQQRERKGVVQWVERGVFRKIVLFFSTQCD